MQKLPIHPEKVTVWCGLWADGIIGPYFFKYVANRNVIVHGVRYREMISNFFLPKRQELDLHDKPASIYALKDNRVCQNWTKRLENLKSSRGQHLHEIIFKH